VIVWFFFIEINISVSCKNDPDRRKCSGNHRSGNTCGGEGEEGKK
jgi:hypothetical protein